ncbi:hypothetical protein [Escherichia coli]|uniref:hypothetical protein n=1 Tax=Escherichia coli TaxID=562 RepID=UPI001E34FA62|nr:hypothetical protein [Escherichia coli]MCC4747481.1 hypothetical protein [Escherichia coli]
MAGQDQIVLLEIPIQEGIVITLMLLLAAMEFCLVAVRELSLMALILKQMQIKGIWEGMLSMYR